MVLCICMVFDGDLFFVYATSDDICGGWSDALVRPRRAAPDIILCMEFIRLHCVLELSALRQTSATNTWLRC